MDFKTTDNDTFSIGQVNGILGSFVPGDAILINGAVGANMIFGNAGTADKMIIEPNNNVGIGYAIGSSLTDKFNVFGSSGFDGNIYINNGYRLAGYDSSGNQVLHYLGDSAPTMQLGFIDNTWYDMNLQNGYVEVLDNTVIAANGAQWLFYPPPMEPQL
jgi:hypothetical protein